MVSVGARKKQLDMRTLEEYIDIKDLVQLELSTPRGTDEAQMFHAEQMKKAEVDTDAKQYVKNKIRGIVSNTYTFSDEELDTLVEQVYGDLFGLGIIQHLDEKEGVAEIFIDAWEWPEFKCMVHVKETGKPQYRYDGLVYSDLEEVHSAFNNILRFSGEGINKYDNATIEAIRPNRDRITVSVPKDSSSWWMRIRKFNNFLPTIDNMIKHETLTQEMADFLLLMQESYYCNTAFMGPLGSAKTSTMNGFLAHDDITKGITAIVETDEMNYRLLGNHLLTVLEIDEDRGRTFEKHLATALRSSAKRIVVPESRGAGFDFLIRTLSQIRGGMFTIHADDADGGMNVMVDILRNNIDSQGETEESLQSRIAKTVNLAVPMRPTGNKIRMWSISEYVVDEHGKYAGTNDIFRFVPDKNDPTKGHYEYTGNKISDHLREKMIGQGIKASRLERW